MSFNIIESMSMYVFYIVTLSVCINIIEFLPNNNRYVDWINIHAMKLFSLHCPSIFLILYFCTGDACWYKYIGGALMCWCIWDGGRSALNWKMNWYTILMINAHHLGPVIAFLYQTNEHVWLNATLFSWVWFPHSWTIFSYLPKNITQSIIFRRFKEYGYTSISIYLVWNYFQSYPVGYNYQTLAVFLQFLGRNLVANNWLNITWLGSYELPGVFTAMMTNYFGYYYGGIYCFIIITIVVCCVKIYYKIFPATIFPEKVTLNDNMKKFLNNYPKGIKDDPIKLQKGLDWLNGQSWAKNYPMLIAASEGNDEKIDQLMAGGLSPDIGIKEWYNSKPIGFAAAFGNVDTLIKLILLNCNPFEKYENSTMTQMSYAYNNGPKFIKEFIDQLCIEQYKITPKLNKLLKPKKTKVL